MNEKKRTVVRTSADNEMMAIRHIRKELDGLTPVARLRVFNYMINLLREEADAPVSDTMPAPGLNPKQPSLPLDESEDPFGT